MCNKKIIAVQYRDPKTNIFRGREYTYFSTVDLSVGDIIIVPVGQGTSVARVCNIDVSESKVDERIMKTINEVVRPLQTCRVCGCSEDRACPGGCYWVEPDLCSTCAGQEGRPTSE